MTGIEVENRDGIAFVCFDRPEAGPNLLDSGALAALPGVLERLEQDDRIEGVILVSRKAEGFIAGADIAIFDQLSERSEALDLIRHAQGLVERFAALPKPTVAAIHGTCAGGGLELALACDFRLASDSPSTSLSLPEVQLGLLPALGGTQRLPRQVGLPTGLDLLLSGRKVHARSARRIGLVEALSHREGLEGAAVAAAKALLAGRRSPRRRSRPPVDKLLDWQPARELVFRRAGREMQGRTRGNYPAPERILDIVRRTFGRPLADGLAAEAEAFCDLLFTPESRGLRHLFFLDVRKRKSPYPTGAEQEVTGVGVLGAGLMGAGIAQVSLEPGGYRVVVKDRTAQLAAAGKKAVYLGLTELVGKKLTRFQRDATLERLLPAVDYRQFGRLDLTIEAVNEDLALKRAVLAEVEEVTDDDHIFASNTSSLPISTIAEGCQRPANVVGMHYFSPVPKMPLLEVVRGPATSERALATAVAVGIRQGKRVIVVGDSPGFYVNRILAPYLNEALLLLREGAAVDRVDQALESAGFPVGPFRLLDNVGLEVAVKVTGVLRPLFARRGMELDDAGRQLLDAGMTGKRGGRGFYLYGKSGGRRVNGEVARTLGVDSKSRPSSESITQRLLLAMVNEAVRCLDEGIISSEEDGDAGAVFGVGFPPFLGGPFHYLEASGKEEVFDRLLALVREHGERFRPARGLAESLGERPATG